MSNLEGAKLVSGLSQGMVPPSTSPWRALHVQSRSWVACLSTVGNYFILRYLFLVSWHSLAVNTDSLPSAGDICLHQYAQPYLVLHLFPLLISQRKWVISHTWGLDETLSVCRIWNEWSLKHTSSQWFLKVCCNLFQGCRSKSEIYLMMLYGWF